jgi:hypothetical protein
MEHERVLEALPFSRSATQENPMFKALIAFVVPFILTAGLATSPSISPSATPSPLVGPGAVLEMHRQLFAAMDRGDVEAAKAFVDGENKDSEREVSLFIPDASGIPTEAWGSNASRELLSRLVADRSKLGGQWTTTITKTSADCPSSSLSFAVLDIERTRAVDGRTEAEKYRSTSLVHFSDGHWKLFHWHLSPAGASASALAKK